MVQRKFNREKTVYLKNDADQLNQMSIWKTEGRMGQKEREEEEEREELRKKLNLHLKP